ncbi:MAG: prepilin peptidase [Zetaproteobacteria bacterium]|nr:prepilin peptidase [Zetaproteobacteria bacterium]
MDVQTFVILMSGMVGLMVGSFSNVCVYRIPRGESVAFPGSHCPNCNHDIAWYDNIPLFSWLILQGKCRHCQLAISARYPFLEVLMGLSWAFLAWKFGPSPMLLEAIVLVSLLWILSLIDYETGYLPDVLTLPGVFIGVAFAWWVGDIQSSLWGAVVGYGAFWLVAKLFFLVTKKEGMGAGDFKLLAMLGAFMGWQALPFIVFVSSLVGAVVGFAYLKLSKQGRDTEIPFGPYLAMAGMLWFLWGHEILSSYRSLLFP